MIGSYEKEIKTNTECAVVEYEVDGRAIKLGICRYVQNDKATDPERPSADSFEKIASNRMYGYGYNSDSLKLVSCTPVDRVELEKLTGVDWYEAGSEALEQDEWAKVIRTGTSQRDAALMLNQDQEFIDSEVDEID